MVVVLFFLITFWIQFQQKTAVLSPAAFNLPTGSTNWQQILNTDAQRHAVKEWCTSQGYDYRLPTSSGDFGGCLYNQASCLADSNPHWVHCTPVTGTSGGIDHNGKPCDLNAKPYLEWNEGSKTCVQSFYPPALIAGVCEARGLGPWYPGTLDCDASGYCQLTSDIPTCQLTSEYCDRMGLDYSSSSQGDCTLSDVQNVFEGLVGKTVTRTVKRNTEAMIRECGDNVLSANCALSIGTELTTFDQIALNTAESEFKGYMENMKVKCSGDLYSGIDKFAGCAESLFPGFYIGEQAEHFVDGMLNGALGWIPGMPSDLIAKANGYIAKYGTIAFNAIVTVGVDAVKAFDIAGDLMYAALDKIGPVGTIIAGAIKNVIAYGEKMASIIANTVQEALHIFSNTIVPAAYHVFEAITDAVLHPKEFFTNLGNDIDNFLKDPVGSIKNAITAIAKVGGEVLDAAKMVFNKLISVASTVEAALSAALVDIANHLIAAFNKVGNDLKSAYHAVKHFFESIF